MLLRDSRKCRCHRLGGSESKLLGQRQGGLETEREQLKSSGRDGSNRALSWKNCEPLVQQSASTSPYPLLFPLLTFLTYHNHNGFHRLRFRRWPHSYATPVMLAAPI